jgi:hypothetical protein
MALSFRYLMARGLVGLLLGRLQSEPANDVEIAVLRHQRHQLDVLRRQVKPRVPARRTVRSWRRCAEPFPAHAGQPS